MLGLCFETVLENQSERPQQPVNQSLRDVLVFFQDFETEQKNRVFVLVFEQMPVLGHEQFLELSQQHRGCRPEELEVLGQHGVVLPVAERVAGVLGHRARLPSLAGCGA